MKPLVYDLCCGLGGWTEGFQAEGWRAIGYDIEAHKYGDHRYPGELRLKSILDLHGSELADADAIVASPPCQEFSVYVMPWGALWQEHNRMDDDGGPAGNYLGKNTVWRGLFETCFRLQREASIAARRHIPLVVENVKGAQPWVGRAAWHYGSFYLWGDVPALMPTTLRIFKTVGHVNKRDGHSHTRHLTNQRESDAVKQAGLSGPAWFDGGMAHMSSGSNSRKAASALIAKIPFELSSHIARCFKPRCS